MSKFKAGDRVRIFRKPDMWASLLSNKNPKNNSYPIEVTIEETKDDGNYRAMKADGYGFDLSNLIDNHNIEIIGEVENYKQTKKPLMKTLSNMAKKLLDSDTQTLVKAGYVNSDLELTTDGREALMTILFVANKAAMVESATEKLAEEKVQLFI